MDQPPASIGNDPYYQKMPVILDASNKNDAQLFKAVVNAPFHDKLRALEIDLGAIVLLLVNHDHKTIDRIALSDTASAQGAVRMSAKPFEKIRIPSGHKGNLIARAVETGKPQSTEDWRYLFAPVLTASEAHFNQAGAGIESSYIYPLKGKRDGAMIFSFYQPLQNIGNEHLQFMQYYSELVATNI